MKHLLLLLAACSFDPSKNKCGAAGDCVPGLFCVEGTCQERSGFMQQPAEERSERRFQGDWKLVVTISASPSVQGGTSNIHIRSHHTVEALETEATSPSTPATAG